MASVLSGYGVDFERSATNGRRKVLLARLALLTQSYGPSCRQARNGDLRDERPGARWRGAQADGRYLVEFSSPDEALEYRAEADRIVAESCVDAVIEPRRSDVLIRIIEIEAAEVGAA